MVLSLSILSLSKTFHGYEYLKLLLDGKTIIKMEIIVMLVILGLGLALGVPQVNQPSGTIHTRVCVYI